MSTIPSHDDLLTLPAKKLANMCKGRELKVNGRGKEAYIRALDYARREDDHVMLMKTHEHNVKIMEVHLKNTAMKAKMKTKMKAVLKTAVNSEKEKLHEFSVNANTNFSTQREYFHGSHHHDIPGLGESSSSPSSSPKDKKNQANSFSTYTYALPKKSKNEKNNVNDETGYMALDRDYDEISSNHDEVLYKPVSSTTIQEIDNEIPDYQTHYSHYYEEPEMLYESSPFITQEIDNETPDNQAYDNAKMDMLPEPYQGMFSKGWNFGK